MKTAALFALLLVAATSLDLKDFVDANFFDLKEFSPVSS